MYQIKEIIEFQESITKEILTISRWNLLVNLDSILEITKRKIILKNLAVINHFIKLEISLVEIINKIKIKNNLFKKRHF